MKQMNQARFCKWLSQPTVSCKSGFGGAARPGLQSWGAERLGQVGPGVAVSPMGVWPGTQAWGAGRGGRAGLRL